MQFLALIMAAVLCAPAHAGRHATEVGVVGTHIPDLGDAPAAAEQLVAMLDELGRVTPVAPAELRAQIRGHEDLIIEGTYLGEGRALFEEGRILFGYGNFEEAIGILEGAVASLRTGAQTVPTSKDMIDALLWLGLARASIGDTDAAQSAYKQVLVRDPTRRLDPINFSPKIVELFDGVREQVSDLPRTRLSVASSEPATTFVDGRNLGSTPTLVSDLYPGMHQVLVVTEDGRRHAEIVRMEPHRQHKVQAQPLHRFPEDDGVSPDDRAARTERLYRALGTHMTSPLVLLAGDVGNAQVGVQLYEPRTGNFSRAVVANAEGDPISSMLDLLPTLAAYISEEGTLRTDRVTHRVLPLGIGHNPVLAGMLLDPQQPLIEVVTVTQRRSWGLWAGAVVLAAGGAAAVGYALSPEEEEDPNQGTIIVGPFP